MIPGRKLFFLRKKKGKNTPVVAVEGKISLFALLSVWQNASTKGEGRKEGRNGGEEGKEGTHGEDFLGQPPRPHVGVVDLLEDHPGLVMLPHLTGGTGGSGEGKPRGN